MYGCSRLFTVVTLLILAAGWVFAGGQREGQSPEHPAGGEGRSPVSPRTVPSLAKLYEGFFPIGAAVSPSTLVTQGDLLAAQVNSLVAENDMKWERIHPRPGNEAKDYDFSAADTIVAFAKKHGMLVRGHTLIWHQQVPAWVFRSGGGSSAPASREEVLGRMKEHITTILHHFGSEVYCWDVVNEAIADGSGGWRKDSPWYRAAGAPTGNDGVPEYIEKAFEYAREAAPAAKLFYNDYNIESGPKLERALNLVRALKEKGLIDGVGIQGHWQIQAVDAEQVRRAIDRFAALGVKVQITELDLSVYRWGDNSILKSLPPDRERQQAKAYGELFKMFREEAAEGKLTGVTFWGIADDHTWLDDFPVAGRKNWPLLFDENHQPKLAFWAVARW